MGEEDFTTIRIAKETHKKLVAVGEYGDSMDDIINRLIETYKKSKPKRGAES